MIPACPAHGALNLDEQHLQRVRVDAIVKTLLNRVAPPVARRGPGIPPIHALQPQEGFRVSKISRLEALSPKGPRTSPRRHAEIDALARAPTLKPVGTQSTRASDIRLPQTGAPRSLLWAMHMQQFRKTL